LRFPTSQFTIARGGLVRYEFTRHNEDEKPFSFCSECSALIYQTVTDDSDILSIKGGSLDLIHRINPAGHIWTSSTLEWIKQGNLHDLIHTQQPDRFCDMIAKFKPPTWD